jgi:uncharacterized protein YegP (UPF0339 family)
MNFQIYKDKAGQFRWRLVANNSKIVADSGEGYHLKESCLHEIRQLLREIPRSYIFDTTETPWSSLTKD